MDVSGSTDAAKDHVRMNAESQLGEYERIEEAYRGRECLTERLRADKWVEALDEWFI